MDRHADRPALLALAALDAGVPRRESPPPRPLCDAAHVRVVGDRGSLPTFEIAATMGTSLEQLSKTYAHLLPDSADRARVALDAYLDQAAAPNVGDAQTR